MNGLPPLKPPLKWQGDEAALVYSPEAIAHLLGRYDEPLWAVENAGRVGLTQTGQVSAQGSGLGLCGYVPALPPERLGSPVFGSTYATPYACYCGAMGGGISSEEMLIALGKDRLLGVFGAGGLPPDQVEEAIHKVQAALPAGPYAFNLLNSPAEPALESGAVERFLRWGVHVVEASAYLTPSPALVWYRAAGLGETPAGEVTITNRVIAKLSRLELGRKFLEPASERLLGQLVGEGRLTPRQAELARRVPLADDITVEADSGGHTDNRPLVAVLPAMLALRDEIQARYRYPQVVRVGAAGGIGTPYAALAAFGMGADYIVTGSINQACREAGTSEKVKELLCRAEMTDVGMAPAADMFETGVHVQVLRRGSLFAARAQLLSDLYQRYDAWEAVPVDERQKVEEDILRCRFEAVWEDTQAFFLRRDPAQVERANASPKAKMALVFRWYLGLASRWAKTGEPEREMDYQVWCGPSMGAFNYWVRGTALEPAANRRVVTVTRAIMDGTVFLARLRLLEMQVPLPAGITIPIPDLTGF